MGLREMWKEHQRREEEEKEFRSKQAVGGISAEELSPGEIRKEAEAAKEVRREEIKASRRMREARRKRAPELRREVGEAFEEAEAAEERAKLVETELYGAPLERPVEILRDRWGKEIGRRPLGGRRREEAAKLELAEKQMTESAVRLTEARIGEYEESLRGRKVARRREQVMGPVRGIVGGVTGTVAGVGKALGGFRVQTEPYRFRERPTVIPKPVKPPTTPPAGDVMGLGKLRQLQTQPLGTKISLFPTGPRKKKKQRNTYESNLRKMRKTLFG